MRCCNVVVKYGAWSVCRGAAFGCGGVVVPIAPASEALKQPQRVMVGSWHVGGESSPTGPPCTCRRGVPVLRPPGGPEHPLPLPSLFIPRCPQPWAKPCLELVVPVAAGSRQGGEVRSRGAGGALRQAWLLQRVSESCSHQHGPGNCLILPALPAKDGISVCRRNTVLQTGNYPGRGFASVPARAPALRWPLCPSPCGGARGGLQAGWIPAAARGSCLQRLACGSAPQQESSWLLGVSPG